MTGIHWKKTAPTITCTAEPDPDDKYLVPRGWEEVASLGPKRGIPPFGLRIDYSVPILGTELETVGTADD
jgi:hypothetical protein